MRRRSKKKPNWMMREIPRSRTGGLTCSESIQLLPQEHHKSDKSDVGVVTEMNCC